MRNYPFGHGHIFPRNQWYIAAWSSELTNRALARVILNQNIVLFRSGSGAVTALSGLCPHRWAPLANAVVDGDTIACPYHGARFNMDGQCTSVPFQNHIPPALRLRAYSVLERGGVIWIWAGDADAVDLSLLPDTDSLGLGIAGWRLDTSPTLLLKARSQILLENLFDQSHVGFTHVSTLGARETNTKLPKPAEIVDQPLYLSFRHEPTVRPTDAAVRSMFPGVGDHAAIMLRSELFGVALINGVGTQTLATDAQGESRRCVGSMNFLHGVTPATDTTTHYFIAMSRDFALNDDALWRVLEQRNLQVVREDVAMLEAIEPHLEAHGDSDAEVNFMADAAAMRVRRRIQRLILQEAEFGARVEASWVMPSGEHAGVL